MRYTELSESKVEGDLSKYSSTALDIISDLSNRSKNGEYPFEVEEVLPSLLQDAKNNLEQFKRKIKSAIVKIHQTDGWNNSTVLISPIFNTGFDFNLEKAPTSFYVKVSLGIGSEHPGFSVFSDNGAYVVDDVLDSGDPDFFRQNTDGELEQNDYFNLINVLRGNFGLFRDKILTLYTARPNKDKEIYFNKKRIPSNIFLTTSLDEADGYALEYPDRSVWRIKIKKKYLIQTLDTNTVKNYQTKNPVGGDVPVESIMEI